MPIIVLVGFCLYLFRDIILGGHLLFGVDFDAFYLGMKQFLYDEVHSHGSIPYWNPYLFAGIPFWAHFESTIFYPLGFLFWIIPAAKAYGYTAFFHVSLAGIFMYSLARSLGLKRLGSLAAGAVFACNGYIMAILYLGHLGPVQSYIWLPAIILFLNRALHSRTPFRDLALAGTLWGVQILAGAPQDAFYSFLASFFFLLCSYSQFPIRVGETRIRFVYAVLILFFAGAGLSAIQVVPGIEFINESVRSTLDSFADVTSGSYPPEGIITAILPHFFGEYAGNNYWVENVPWSVPQQSLYAGLLPILALFLIVWTRRANRRILFFFSILAIAVLILAMGGHTPVYKLVSYLPGFDRFRAPSKIIPLWTFAVGLLCAIGVDDLLSSEKHRPRRMILLILLLLCVFLDLGFLWNPSWIHRVFSPFFLPETIPEKMHAAFQVIGSDFHRLTLVVIGSVLLILLIGTRSINRTWGGCLLIALLLFDLSAATDGSIQANDAFHRSLESRKRSLAATLERDGVYRVGSFRSEMSPNAEMVLGYQTVGGFTALILSRYYEYIDHYTENSLPRGWQYFTYGRSPHSGMMDLLNVEYELFHDSGRFTKRESCLPRAFLVAQSIVSPRENVLGLLTSHGFDPTRSVVLEREVSLDRGSSMNYPQGSGIGEARVISYRPDEIRIKFFSEIPALLFMSEIYYPGWKAYMDGEPVEVFRGNYLFRVIPVRQGEHLLTLTFKPLSIYVGIGLTVLTMFFVLLVFIRKG